MRVPTWKGVQPQVGTSIASWSRAGGETVASSLVQALPFPLRIHRNPYEFVYIAANSRLDQTPLRRQATLHYVLCILNDLQFLEIVINY